MGFLYHAVKVPNAINLTLLLNIFTHARFIFVGALTRLGLYKPPPEEDANSRSDNNNYILILDPTSPSLVPVPVHAATNAVKSRVPVVKYQDFLIKRRQLQESEIVIEEEEKVCSVCLEQIGLCEEIRELCNCGHVFHRACLDTWIDEGQVTCPLCRSMLLPPRTILHAIYRCNNNFQNHSQQSTSVVI